MSISGLSWLDVVTICNCPLLFNNQAHPEPKCPNAFSLNSALNFSIVPYCSLIASSNGESINLPFSFYRSYGKICANFSTHLAT